MRLPWSALLVAAPLAAAFSPGALPRHATTFLSIATTTNPATRETLPGNRGMSPLRMGKFEDFLSGQDANKRSKGNEAYLQQLASRVDRINLLEPTVEDLGDDELESKTAEFKERLTAGEDLNGALLEEAFAIVREAAW
jgi:hypothetical protein